MSWFDIFFKNLILMLKAHFQKEEERARNGLTTKHFSMLVML
jgi:hypothetical protein